MKDDNLFELFASCPKGLELLLLEELQSLGAEQARETIAGVYFSASLKALYSICLWSRLASRITLPLLECPADSVDVIHQTICDFAWEKHFNGSNSILVNFSGTNAVIKNTQFGAQKVKDGIVDRFRAKTGERPSVEKINPDIRLQAFLGKGIFRLSIDISGGSLQNRTYNKGNQQNALHANLATALLIRSQWTQLCENDAPFYDLQCDEGTLLIEAAMMKYGIAPGLFHDGFGFEKWLKHSPSMWHDLLESAQQTKQDVLSLSCESKIIGYDYRTSKLKIGREKINDAGFSDLIQVRHSQTDPVENDHKEAQQGLILSAFPYVDPSELNAVTTQTYTDFGQHIKQNFIGWKAGLFTVNIDQARHLNIRAQKKYKFQFQEFPAQLLLFDIKPEYFYQRDAGQSSLPKELSEGALMFSNRIKKNQKQLSKWLAKEQITCYRLYDADMPEYAVAVDIFEDESIGRVAHVQEYIAPKKVDPKKAQQRFLEVQAALPEALNIDNNNIVYKQRRQQKGKAQYERQSEKSGEFLTVKEGQAKLLINLHDYLDVGLFLDHRPLRMEIAALAKDQSFLNLFCYTASPTVHAALAGASSSVSVDMSNTYINWAERNFKLNGINIHDHQLIQADCFQWLKQSKEKFDIIMLDPPSFSNSKRMDSVLDIQRDHVGLIKLAARRLADGGTLIFSNNLRSFKLDHDALEQFDITDISKQTLDRDFQRNQKIHQCWLISKV